MHSEHRDVFTINYLHLNLHQSRQPENCSLDEEDSSSCVMVHGWLITIFAHCLPLLPA